MRAAIYARVSTSEQANSGTSLETQVRAAREWAASRGHDVIEHQVVTEDHTGTDLERPGLQRLLEAAASGQFDIVVVYTLDRLYRPAAEGDEWQVFHLLSRFRDHGVSVEFVDPALPSSGPMSGLIAFMRAYVAGQERRAILERTARGRAARKAEGKWVVGRAPYGYRRGADGRLEVDPAEAEVVMELFAAADARREGLRQLQKLFTGLHPAPDGALVWYQSTLHRILTNSVYTGQHPSGVPAPVLISEDQFKRVQARLKANHRLHPTSTHVRPLAGRMRCACGGGMAFERAKRGAARAYYYCRHRRSYSTHVMKGGVPCTAKPVRALQTEEALLSGLYKSFASPEAAREVLLQSITSMRVRLKELSAEAGPLKQGLAGIDEELREVDRARIRGRLSAAELDRMEADALKRREALEARLSEVSPERLAEAEELEKLVHGAERTLQIAASRITRGLDMKAFSLGPEDFENDQSEEFTDSAENPFLPRQGVPPAEALGRMLDRLHADVVVHPGHLEVRGILDVTVTTGDGDTGTISSLHASRPSGRSG